jgi:hypothetical protein
MSMLAAAPDRFTEFCCDGTMGFLVVVGALYLLLRTFRRAPKEGDGPREDEPL